GAAGASRDTPARRARLLPRVRRLRSLRLQRPARPRRRAARALPAARAALRRGLVVPHPPWLVAYGSRRARSRRAGHRPGARVAVGERVRRARLRSLLRRGGQAERPRAIHRHLAPPLRSPPPPPSPPQLPSPPFP